MATDDAQQRATEFLKELYAAGSIDAGQLDTGVAGVLAARTEAELAGVVHLWHPGTPRRARRWRRPRTS
jgi:DUF1707 SHOCT-like domain